MSARREEPAIQDGLDRAPPDAPVGDDVTDVADVVDAAAPEAPPPVAPAMAPADRESLVPNTSADPDVVTPRSFFDMNVGGGSGDAATAAAVDVSAKPQGLPDMVSEGLATPEEVPHEAAAAHAVDPSGTLAVTEGVEEVHGDFDGLADAAYGSPPPAQPRTPRIARPAAAAVLQGLAAPPARALTPSASAPGCAALGSPADSTHDGAGGAGGAGGYCTEAEYDARMAKIRRLKRDAEVRRKREQEQRVVQEEAFRKQIADEEEHMRLRAAQREAEAKAAREAQRQRFAEERRFDQPGGGLSFVDTCHAHTHLLSPPSVLTQVSRAEARGTAPARTVREGGTY